MYSLAQIHSPLLSFYYHYNIIIILVLFKYYSIIHNKYSTIMVVSCVILSLQAQYGSEGFDQLADMVYTMLDQYNIYQKYHHYTEYNKLLLLPSTTRTVSATSNSEQGMYVY